MSLWSTPTVTLRFQMVSEADHWTGSCHVSILCFCLTSTASQLLNSQPQAQPMSNIIQDHLTSFNHISYIKPPSTPSRAFWQGAHLDAFAVEPRHQLSLDHDLGRWAARETMGLILWKMFDIFVTYIYIFAYMYVYIYIYPHTSKIGCTRTRYTTYTDIVWYSLI